MTKKVLANSLAGAENGDTMTKARSGASVGGNAKRHEPQSDMLASGTPNFNDLPTLTSDGEPKEVLLALAWSAIETLLARGEAKMFIGKDSVAVIFRHTKHLPTVGFVPDTEVLAEL